MMCFLMFLILKASLEKCDLLLIPIHKRKSHWCLGVGCVLEMSTVSIRSKAELNMHLLYHAIPFQLIEIGKGMTVRVLERLIMLPRVATQVT